MPITGKFPIPDESKKNYKIQEIQDCCDGLLKDGDTVFWVEAEKQIDGSYYLYIGY